MEIVQLQLQKQHKGAECLVKAGYCCSVVHEGREKVSGKGRVVSGSVISGIVNSGIAISGKGRIPICLL